MADTQPHPVERDAAARPGQIEASDWLLLLFVGLLCVALVMPLPFQGRLASAAGDLLHAPAFALFGFGLYRFARRRSRSVSPLATAASVWLLLAVFGAASELAQRHFHRGASWHDAVNDALGAAGGVLIAMALERSRGTARVAGVLVGLAAIGIAEIEPSATILDCYLQPREMPLLASFERARELDRGFENSAVRNRVESHATDGQFALQVDLQPGKYSGIGLLEPPADWSPYRTLAFDIEVAPSARDPSSLLKLIVKIEDAGHNGEYDDRFHQLLRLTPGRQEVRIPLADVVAAPKHRQLDLNHISLLQWFTVDLAEPRTFYLDNVRLE